MAIWGCMFNEITIGADPELAVLNENGDATNVGLFRKVSPEGRFGIDGAGRDFELRPAPNVDPGAVVNNLSECLTYGKELLGKPFDAFHLVAGAGPAGHPIGGHIHFGHNALKSGTIGSSTTIARLIGSLDYYLAPVCALLEDQEDFYRRRGQYGMAHDWRNQVHGVEYRTLSSWLTCPDVSKGVLYLAKIVTDLEHPGQAKVAAIKPIHDGYNEEALRKNVKENRDIICKSSVYKNVPEAKRTIDFLYDMIENETSWMPDSFVFGAWGLRDEKLDRIIIKKELEAKSLKELLSRI